MKQTFNLYKEEISTIDYDTSRTINNLIVPPFITPQSYELSQTLQTREGDICTSSYPKSGSNWLSYVIFLLVHQGNAPKTGVVYDHFIFLVDSVNRVKSRAKLDALLSPRLFRCHMPYSMASGIGLTYNPCKYIHIRRHPKDIVVSYYHFAKDWMNYSGSWEHWLQLFMDGKAYYGDWFEYEANWEEQQGNENILFLWYEEMKSDFEFQLNRIADFLGYPLSQELFNEIKEETSFKKMKNNDFTNMKKMNPTNNFFRKGKVGSWKEKFTPEQNEAFDNWMNKQLNKKGLPEGLRKKLKESK